MMLRPQQRGLTVLELVIAMSILSILLTLTFVIYTTGARAWAKGDAKADLLRAAQVADNKDEQIRGEQHRSQSERGP